MQRPRHNKTTESQIASTLTDNKHNKAGNISARANRTKANQRNHSGKRKSGKRQINFSNKTILLIVAIILFVVIVVLMINKPWIEPVLEPDPTESIENQRDTMTIDISEMDPETYQGEISLKEDEDGYEMYSTDTYTLETTTSGVYGITATDLHNDSSLTAEIYDSNGSMMDSGMGYIRLSNDEGYSFEADEVENVEAKVGETYRIEVSGGTITPYTLMIWKPKEEYELSDIKSIDYTIHDSIQFSGQDNRYSLTPDEDGEYVFWLEDLIDGSYATLGIYTSNNADERFQEELISENYSSDYDEETPLELTGGREYVIHVESSWDEGLCPYTLCVQKVQID